MPRTILEIEFLWGEDSVKTILLRMAFRLLPARWLMRRMDKDTRVVVNCGEEDEMEITLDTFLDNYRVLS